MDRAVSILVVDSDRGFAIMLKQALEQVGGYRVVAVDTATEAFAAIAATRFDLAVIDLGLVHPGGATLARRLRQEQPDIRLMVIPLAGEEIPPELDDLSVQGVLPKPFFFPELGPRFEQALGQPMAGGPRVGEPSLHVELEEPEAGPEPAPVLDVDQSSVLEELRALSEDLHADTLLLTQGSDLVAQVGQLSAEQTGDLVQVVTEGWLASLRIARAIGREPSRFELSVDGGEYVFYGLAVADDVILTAVLPAGIPVGLIRYRVRQAAERLRQLIDREDPYG